MFLVTWLAALATAEEPAPTFEPDLPVEPAALREAIRAQLSEDPEVPAGLAEAIIEELAKVVEAERKLSYETGDVTLLNGLATIHLGDAWRFLDGFEASDVIEGWGNPRPPSPPVGMIVPAGLAVYAPESWAVVLNYAEDGHVDDADAAQTDFDELLRSMQEDTRAANADRTAAGFEALELVGWAEPPHYDAASRKLYWAQHLRTESGESLNYDIRALGRKGVLELSAISSVEMLEIVKPGMEDLLGRVAFNEGNRYTDFDPDVDAVAAFGIGALIAGKVAAKAGLFKLLVAALIAGKKVIGVAVVGLIAGARSLFGRGKGDDGPA